MAKAGILARLLIAPKSAAPASAALSF